MLFYVKRSLVLELAVGVALAGAGLLLIRGLAIPVLFRFTAGAALFGAVGSGILAAWTLLVQAGHAVVKGRAYADNMTRALAAQFKSASAAQMAAAFVAAGGEEVLFRGAIQGGWGIWVGAVAFMLGHIGARTIRVIGYWSVFQGLGLGLLYRWSGNLAVPVVAHGLFDLGAMGYFRHWMRRGGRR